MMLMTTNLTKLLSPSVMHSLGWTLLHFLWQGTALAALAAVLMTLCRRASARYVVAVGALALMLAAPVATFFFLIPSGEAVPSSSVPAGSGPGAEAHQAVTAHIVGTSSAFSRVSSSRDALPWLVEA